MGGEGGRGKTFLSFFEQPLDKRAKMWYNGGVVGEVVDHNRSADFFHNISPFRVVLGRSVPERRLLHMRRDEALLEVVTFL
jgi:hypothetical protein